MKYYALPILLLLIFVIGCNKKKEISEDEQHVNMYFSEKQKINLADLDNYFLIFISGNCGSCTEKTIKFLKQLGSPSDNKFANYKKIVVVPDNNAYVLDSVKNSTIQFIVDQGYELDKYGVKFDKNTFFEFKNHDLIYQDKLYLDNVDTIAKKYGFGL